ncbi:MAG: tetratricopeptide repeat-containing diguanylate cyclase [Bacillota bacterium]
MNESVEKVVQEKLKMSKSIVNRDPEQAMQLCNEAFKMASEREMQLEMGDSLLGMALVARTKTDKSAILDYSFQALEKYRLENSNEGIAKSYNLIGVAYFYSSMYEEALRYFLDGLDKIEDRNNPMLLGSILNNIGEVYRESGMYNEALDYYNRAYDISTQSNLENYRATILGNIGEVQLLENHPELALEYLSRAYGFLKDGNDLVIMGEVENKIGRVYKSKGDISTAVDHYKRALRALEEVDNQFYKIDVLANLAETKENPEEAIAILKDAISSALVVGAKKKLSKLYKQVSLQYENVMDFRTALSYYKKYFLINQEILNSNIRNKLEILNVEIKYLEESERLDKVKRTLQKELEENRKELETQKRSNFILEREAFEDDLTEMPNRRSVARQLKKLLKNYRGKDHSLSVYMIDIDRFKEYNDYWGHGGGDQCLRSIAHAMQGVARIRGDFAGRYGGEEFVYIAKINSYKEALDLAEKIRKSVESIGLPYNKRTSRGPVTVSVGGIFGKTIDFKDFAQVMELADKELYFAKSRGRNQSSLAVI